MLRHKESPLPCLYRRQALRVGVLVKHKEFGVGQLHGVGHKIYVGVASGVGLTAISALVGFVQFRLIVEFLPKDLAGVWFLFLNIGAYLTYFDLGISPTVSREVGFISGRTSPDDQACRQEIADLLATCIMLFRSLGLIVFVLCLILGGLLIYNVVPAVSRMELGIAWMIFAVGASCNLAGGAWYSALYGLGHVATERVLRGCTQLFGLFLIAMFLSAGFGIVGLSVAWTLQGLAVCVAGMIALYRKCPFLRSKNGTASRAILKRLALPSIKLAATGLGAILILQTDNIIIASVIGPAAIPPYEAAARLSYYCSCLSMLIIGSSTPFISKLSVVGDRDSMRGMILKNVRYSMSLMIVLAAFFAVFSDRAIQIWLGNGNFVGYPIIWIMFVMLTLEVHHNILGSATMATGRVIFHWVALGAGILNIVLSLILVRYFGLLGVALGTLLAQLLTNNWFVSLVSLRHFHIDISAYLRTIVIPLLVVFALLIIVNHGISLLLGDFGGVFGFVTACVVSFSLGAFLTGGIMLNRDERNEILACVLRRRTVS